ncbi:hypothetical protein GCM10020001_097630 [Nonomuraea salmonea]
MVPSALMLPRKPSSDPPRAQQGRLGRAQLDPAGGAFAGVEDGDDPVAQPGDRIGGGVPLAGRDEPGGGVVERVLVQERAQREHLAEDRGELAERAHRATLLEQGAQGTYGLQVPVGGGRVDEPGQHGVAGQLGVGDRHGRDAQPQRRGQHAYGQTLGTEHAADLGGGGEQRAAAGERPPEPPRPFVVARSSAPQAGSACGNATPVSADVACAAASWTVSATSTSSRAAARSRAVSVSASASASFMAWSAGTC